MKRVSFSLIASFFLISAAVAVNGEVVPDPLKVLDSTEVFQDITDISKQIRLRANRSDMNEEPAPIQLVPDQLVPDQLVPDQAAPVQGDGSVIIPRDTLPVMGVADTIPSLVSSVMDSIVPIRPISLFRNPLDSIYFRKENG